MSRALEIIKAREPIGWRLGLERMRRLCTLLGMPQQRFASIHVVGTNGKTSVTLMTAARLEARGVRSGAYVSPHIVDWRERIRIAGEPIAPDAFERALVRTEQAAAVADRSAEEDGPVTQYELVTAAAFLAFAEARVEVAVVEAGLGGRLDATNVIPSRVTVLTSVGLDHTEWLGETVEEIAAEKLAVLRDHSTLICGELPAEVEPVVERELERRHATRVHASGAGRVSRAGSQPFPGYQQRNLALAAAAAPAVLGDRAARPAEPEAGWISVPGRAELIDGNPPVVLDAAHNPDGARALAAALPSLAGEREVVCCLAALAEKDAAGIVEALAPACAAFVCTEIPAEAIIGSGRPAADSHPASSLALLCEARGVPAEAAPDPLAAWGRALELARGRGGVALAAGSHYLLSCIWTERHAASS